MISLPSTAKQEVHSESIRNSRSGAMRYLFPLSFLLNSLATMGLLIGLSLLGKSLQSELESALVEKAFLYVPAILIPLQLFAAWWQRNVLLSPYLYPFSV